jgi:hypothetical protein
MSRRNHRHLPPSFDAASVRPNITGDRNTSVRRLPGGPFTATSVPVVLLVQMAFRLQPFQCGAHQPGFVRTASMSSREWKATRRRPLSEAPRPIR